MGLSEVPDILSPVILHLGGHNGDGSLCDEISLIRCRRRRFFYFLSRKNAYIFILVKAWSGQTFWTIS
jgi:hypothetical protein